MDTDSVVYLHPEDDDPLPTGPHLGDLTDECAGKRVLEFYCAGCKNYAFEYEDNGEIKHILKIRGFTLDYSTCQLLHYDAFKQKVIDYGTNFDPIPIPYNNCLRPDLKAGTVYTTSLTKNYRPVISKGIVDDDFNVISFGF